MSEKGALHIDKMAHTLMEFRPERATESDGYTAFYHEERLYSVRNNKTGIVSLAYADSPYSAIEKVSGKNTTYYAIQGLLGIPEQINKKVCLWHSKQKAEKERDKLAEFINERLGYNYGDGAVVIEFKDFHGFGNVVIMD